MTTKESIFALLEQGKNMDDIVARGFKKGTVYGAVREWRRRRGRPEAATSTAVNDQVRQAGAACTNISDADALGDLKTLLAAARDHGEDRQDD